MKSISIRHNSAIESVCALFRYASFERYADMVFPGGLPGPSEGIERWFRQTGETMPKLLDLDIKAVITDCWFNPFCTIDTAVKDGIDDPGRLILAIEGLSAAEFLKRLFSTFDFDDARCTLSDPPEKIARNIEAIRSGHEAEMFLYTLEHPESMKTRVIQVMTDFFDLISGPVEKMTHETMERTATEHEKELNRDPVAFFRNYLLIDLNKKLVDKESITIFISHYLDYDFIYFEGSRPAMVYGVGRIQEHMARGNQEKVKDLFKALGDDRRLEILYLLSRRKWYSNELAEHFDLTPATMSYHMNRLTALGIVSYETGTQNKLYYRVNREKLDQLLKTARRELIQPEH